MITLKISKNVKEKINTFILNSNTGVSWCGLIKYNKENYEYFWYDIYFPPQERKEKSSNLSINYFNWIKDFEEYDNIKMFGHSHVSSNVFPSLIVLNYYLELIEEEENKDFYFFIILNNKKEYYLSFLDLKNNKQILQEDINIIYE